MKRTFKVGAALMLTMFVVTSCKKFGKMDGTTTDSQISDLIRSGYMVTVSSSNYQVNETASLQQADSDSPYTAGILEYEVNGNLESRVDFSAGGNEAAVCYDIARGTSMTYDLKKDKDGYDKKGDKWKKVVIEPLVYSEDCGYIVAGIVKFYDYDSGDWLATFDYGNGTCDDMIDKLTHDGTYAFSMNDYPEWNYQ